VTAGAYREVAELNRRELEIFWSRPFAPIRARNSYNLDVIVDDALGPYFAAEAAVVMSSSMKQDIAEIVDPKLHVVAKLPEKLLAGLL
jgi:hypothetical protein